MGRHRQGAGADGCAQAGGDGRESIGRWAQAGREAQADADAGGRARAVQLRRWLRRWLRFPEESGVRYGK